MHTQQSDRTAWLKGGAAHCLHPPPEPVRPYRLILLGAPGVGKGTQAELLSHSLGACQLSTGDVFRAAREACTCEQTPSIATALEQMRRGELVGDDTVLGIVRERSRCLRCYGGFLLDGFPRTLLQAEALEEILAEQGVHLDAVISYDLALDVIIARVGGRLTCRACKAVFHAVTRRPKIDGICNRCGGELFVREDDGPEAVRTRMQAYEQNTTPLKAFYESRGNLLHISAVGTPEEIHQCTLRALATRIDGAASA